MATYRVPQNVEAEDKLLGPLTFKQFIFLLVAAGAALMAWALFQVQPLLGLLPVPVIIVFGGLAFFRREDQPVERYLLSFFNFLLRPRTRIWSTEGYYEHLVITAPKRKPKPELKRNISEVHGQLEKLAQTVDTRGWASKRPDLRLPGGGTTSQTTDDDRLFFPETPLQPEEIHEREDMMDEQNPEVMQMDNLLYEATQQQREEMLARVQQQANKPPQITTYHDEPQERQQGVNAQQSKQPSQERAADLANEQVQPVASAAAPVQAPDAPAGNAGPAASAEQSTSSAPATDPAILELAENNDLSVSQIAAQAKRKSDELQAGEEISLR